MKPFQTLTGIVVPLDRPNVDTDAIIPKQFLKSISRLGFGPYLFDEWRYLDHGEYGQDCSKRPENIDFVLNQARYQGATIMLTRDNFGCGSSREHAVWALEDFGIRCIIGTSFADIFFSNCGKNGVLAIVLPAAEVNRLFAETLATPAYQLAIDLQHQTIVTPAGDTLSFAIDEALKQRLLQGLDDIAVTLQDADAIRLYEAKRQRETPWLFS
jgi:3-isopropylmalate/(R)-2-methylmalate dehydratase small subunit